MFKPNDPRQLVIDLLPRSICSVQVAAVIADSHGILSWGWNNVGEGYGQHAENHAIWRANKRRLAGAATIYVASRRMRGFGPKAINSRPCEECMKLIGKYDLDVVFRAADGEWYD